MHAPRNPETQVDGGTTASYVYDAFSRRVRVNVPGGSDADNLRGPRRTPLLRALGWKRECVYDLGSHCIAEFTSSSGARKRSEIYALGQSIATYNNGTTYFNHTDHLGSTRAQSTLAGTVQSTCFYQPFGDATTCTNPTSRDQYTGYEHDTESGLDHAWFRQYGSNAGRFVPIRMRGVRMLRIRRASIGMRMWGTGLYPRLIPREHVMWWSEE